MAFKIEGASSFGTLSPRPNTDSYNGKPFVTYILSGLLVSDVFFERYIIATNSDLFSQIVFEKHIEQNSEKAKQEISPFKATIFLQEGISPFDKNILAECELLIDKIIINIIYNFKLLQITHMKRDLVLIKDTKEHYMGGTSNKVITYVHDLGKDTIDDVKNFTKLPVSLKKDYQDEIINIISIDNDVIKFLMLYEILYKECGSTQAKVDSELKSRNLDTKYSIKFISEYNCKAKKTKIVSNITSLRNKIGHSMIKNYSDYKKYENEVAVNLSTLICVLIDILN